MKKINNYIRKGLFLGKFVIESVLEKQISIYVDRKLVILPVEFILKQKYNFKQLIEICELEASL